MGQKLNPFSNKDCSCIVSCLFDKFTTVFIFGVGVWVRREEIICSLDFWSICMLVRKKVDGGVLVDSYDLILVMLVILFLVMWHALWEQLIGGKE